MNDEQALIIAQLVQKLSDYSGLSVEVLDERLQERGLEPEAAISLLSDQIFCYEADAVDFASEIKELQRPSAKWRYATSTVFA